MPYAGMARRAAGAVIPDQMQDLEMLHIHFGAGRLGLGLVVPFFQKTGSKTFILNRAVSGAKPTGSTALDPKRRNDLLRENPDKCYVIQEPGAQDARRRVVHYDGFFEYNDEDVEEIIRPIVEGYPPGHDCVVVTASLLTPENYRPVLQALASLAAMKKDRSGGPIFFVACENTFSAQEVLDHKNLCEMLPTELRGQVTCVAALVDRVCVGLEEAQEDSHPAVLVHAEEYGSLKLELTPETEPLATMLKGSEIEFTKHVAVEKQIKNWLLNGSHWLLALAAFQESGGDRDLKLNAFLQESPQRREYAESVMAEMREGVLAILRRQPEYAEFVRDVDADAYLKGAAHAILERFMSNEDPISRILARFQAPTSESPASVQAFSQRLADRVDEPISAYVEDKGMAPPAATQSIQSLVRLIASGTFINAA